MGNVKALRKSSVLSSLGPWLRPVALLCVFTGLLASWALPARCGDHGEERLQHSASLAQALHGQEAQEGEGASHDGCGHERPSGSGHENRFDDCAQPPALPPSHIPHTMPVALAPAPQRPLPPIAMRGEVPQPVPIVLPGVRAAV